MQARRCQGCAAPLPESAAAEPVRCPFCGLLHDAASANAAHVQVVRSGTVSVRGLRGWVIGLIGIILVAAVVPMFIGVFVAWKAGSAALDVASSVAGGTTTAARQSAARTTAQLKDLPAGYHPLQVAPPPTGYGAVDPVAALPWALAIAQAWRPDARLERIDVSRLRPDGTVNVADDEAASLTYRFVSAGAVAALAEQARLGPSAEAVVAMWVRITRGAPQVYGSAERAGRLGSGASSPPHPDAEAVARLLSRPAVQALRGDLPFLNGYLIHLKDEGWVWYLSSLADESKPRVRARDGAVWPYRVTRS